MARNKEGYMPVISVVVLNWNGKRFIDKFMESVERQKLNGIELEVLFTDNNSSDDSVDYFNKKYANDSYRVIRNDRNYGYAKGNNLGIAQAKGDYILICNNDLELDENLVQELYDTLQREKADLAVPKLMFLNKPGYINNAGSQLNPGSNWPIYEHGYDQKDEGQYDKIREITAFCGACVLFRRDFMETVGTYDDKFFMYFEDGDLSWRGQTAGKKFVYAPKAVAYHVHTGSSKEGSPLFVHFVARNRLLILTKNAGPRVIASGWKVTLKDHFVRRIKNLAKALLGRYSKRQAIIEFARSQKTIWAALFLTPYCLAKRFKLIHERTI